MRFGQLRELVELHPRSLRVAGACEHIDQQCASTAKVSLVLGHAGEPCDDAWPIRRRRGNVERRHDEQCFRLTLERAKLVDELSRCSDVALKPLYIEHHARDLWIVRRKLDVRKASFAPMDVAVAESGMEYGGITPVGLPADWPVWVDAAVADTGLVMIGAGYRRAKLILPGAALLDLPGAERVEGLARDLSVQ